MPSLLACGENFTKETFVRDARRDDTSGRANLDRRGSPHAALDSSWRLGMDDARVRLRKPSPLWRALGRHHLPRHLCAPAISRRQLLRLDRFVLSNEAGWLSRWLVDAVHRVRTLPGRVLRDESALSRCLCDTPIRLSPGPYVLRVPPFARVPSDPPSCPQSAAW